MSLNDFYRITLEESDANLSSEQIKILTDCLVGSHGMYGEFSGEYEQTKETKPRIDWEKEFNRVSKELEIANYERRALLLSRCRNIGIDESDVYKIHESGSIEYRR